MGALFAGLIGALEQFGGLPADLMVLATVEMGQAGAELAGRFVDLDRIMSHQGVFEASGRGAGVSYRD